MMITVSGPSSSIAAEHAVCVTPVKPFEFDNVYMMNKHTLYIYLHPRPRGAQLRRSQPAFIIVM
jgi:hypothetical protein